MTSVVPPRSSMSVAAGVFAVNASGLVLAVSRGPGRQDWGLPFGFVEAGETAEAAAARETREETGLTAERLRFVYAAEVKDTWAVTFLADVEGTPVGSAEGDAAWVHVDLVIGPQSSFQDYNRLLVATLLRRISAL